MLPVTASRRSSSSRPPGSTLGLPLAHHLGDREHDLLAVPEDRGVDEVGDRLGVERGVAAGDDDRVVLAAVDRVERDPGQVEGVEHVGVAELGGEAQAEEVERADGAVAVDGELRDRALLVTLAHHPLHVGPHRVGALGDDPVALVEHLVEDLDALVGQAHLVGVGVHQRPPDRRPAGLGRRGAVPVLDDRVELAADVLDGLLHRGKPRLQAREDRRDGHDSNTSNGDRDQGRAGAADAPTLKVTSRRWCGLLSAGPDRPT